MALWRGRPTRRYGEILLSLLLLWAYLHAMQYIIIWAGNIPDEVTWYLRRASGGWAVVLWGLMLGQFVIPFFALLSERVRYGQRPLLWLCGATLALRLVEAFWLVLPSTHAGGWVLLLDIPAVTLVLAAVWSYAFWRASSRSISPTAGGQRRDAEQRDQQQQAVNRQRINPGRRIEAIADEPHRIGQIADAAFAGFHQRQPKVGRIEREAGEHAGEAAVAGEHERHRRMGDLIVLRIVSRAVAERRLDLRQRICVRRQKGGGPAPSRCPPRSGRVSWRGHRPAGRWDQARSATTR